jgi:hypothetical protein
MNLKVTLTSLTAFLNKVTKLLIPLVLASLLLGIIFGTSTPFVGDVYKNVADILNMLGEDALLALISVVIILAYLKKDSFFFSTSYLYSKLSLKAFFTFYELWWLWVDLNHRPRHYECRALTS